MRYRLGVLPSSLIGSIFGCLTIVEHGRMRSVCRQFKTIAARGEASPLHLFIARREQQVVQRLQYCAKTLRLQSLRLGNYIHISPTYCSVSHGCTRHMGIT
jgi:hypothetical protein